ncbi:hypothetical protein EJV47_10995 [Hymenobacter gummosus]|uniref:PorT family protein n=1 Tax=Hymenobacter gummosus TaxID=1776032 RepID=A0A431U3P9_9BACT|nr:hypothetical protein [Hymenobacter gummosus]RTQ50154.1 hypothetical protein EJV47_10995 [Hymenobacter gummosus]
MRKNLLLTAAAVVFRLTAMAQAGFQPGYTVSASGDTLRGEVKLQSAPRNAVECRFRPAAAAPEQVLTPAQLRGYGAAGQTFERLPLDTAAVFAEVLVKGPVQLLYAAGTRTERYFLRRGGRLTELRQQVTEVKRGAQVYIATTRMYRDTLAVAFRDCPKAVAYAQNAMFRLDDLSKAVYRYNACLGAAVAPKQRRNVMQLGLTAGYALTDQFRMGRADGSSSINKVYDGQPFFNAGLSLYIKPGFARSPLTLLTGVGAELNRRFAGTVDIGVTQTQITVHLDYATMPLLLRYSPRQQGRVHPYVEAGGSLRLLVKVDRDEKVFLTTPRIVEPFLGTYKKLGAGAVGGVGVALGPEGGRHLWLGLRGEVAMGPSFYAGNSSFRTVQVQVGYQLTGSRAD